MAIRQFSSKNDALDDVFSFFVNCHH